ncbi:hypothetical protein PG995_004514 [Apiospora arundinis]
MMDRKEEQPKLDTSSTIIHQTKFPFTPCTLQINEEHDVYISDGLGEKFPLQDLITRVLLKGKASSRSKACQSKVLDTMDSRLKIITAIDSVLLWYCGQENMILACALDSLLRFKDLQFYLRKKFIWNLVKLLVRSEEVQIQNWTRIGESLRVTPFFVVWDEAVLEITERPGHMHTFTWEVLRSRGVVISEASSPPAYETTTCAGAATSEWTTT